MSLYQKLVNRQTRLQKTTGPSTYHLTLEKLIDLHISDIARFEKQYAYLKSKSVEITLHKVLRTIGKEHIRCTPEHKWGLQLC